MCLDVTADPLIITASDEQKIADYCLDKHLRGSTFFLEKIIRRRINKAEIESCSSDKRFALSTERTDSAYMDNSATDEAFRSQIKTLGTTSKNKANSLAQPIASEMKQVQLQTVGGTTNKSLPISTVRGYESKSLD